MSKLHPIYLEMRPDKFADEWVCVEADLIAGLIHVSPSALRKYVFGLLMWQPFDKARRIEEEYGSQVPEERELEVNEIDACNRLQNITNRLQDKRSYKKALSLILERYFFKYQEKCFAPHGKVVYHNAALYIHNVQFMHLHHGLVDVGVDMLDAQDSTFQLAECASNIHLFLEEDKNSQVEFYAEGLLQTRLVVGTGSDLRIILVCGYLDQRNFREELNRRSLLRRNQTLLYDAHIGVFGFGVAEDKWDMLD